MKDLPDIALLATARTLEAKNQRHAIEQTFTFRKTHAVPARFPAPCPAWAPPYAAMAREDQLTWPTREEVAKAAQAFLDPVLGAGLDGTRAPEHWRWRSRQIRVLLRFLDGYPEHGGPDVRGHLISSAGTCDATPL